MTRVSLPRYVKPIPGRGGRVYLYFRRGRTYLRLPDDPSSAEFHEAYALAVRGGALPSRRALLSGSVDDLIAQYKGAPEYRALAPKTQRDYARALDHMGLAIGRFPARDVRRSDVVRLRNKIAESRGDRSADLFVAVVSRCYAIGLDLGLADVNPAAAIDRLAVSESYLPWPAHVRAAMEASSPPGHVMTGYMLALWTALRASDVVLLGRQHYDGTGFVRRPGKTRRSSGIELYIPAARPLRDYLARLPQDRLTWVTRDDGAPLRADSLSKDITAWLAGLGITGYTMHGLRHTTGTALAECGATAHEIKAILGHTTLQMAERYTARADQRRLAVSGMAKLERTGTERENGKPRRKGGKHRPEG